MASLKDKFIAGCEANGVPAATAHALWAKVELAADYSFNKAHAACYGLIAYRTAYLRANYPAEYMAALISSVMSTKDRVPFYVGECADMGVEVLPPDVNSSRSDFAVVEGRIRFGLAAVKRVGEGAVRAIIAARSERPFDSIWDFCERVDMAVLNRGMVESLIACGAFDSTGATRRGMFDVLEQAISAGQRTQSDALVGQGSIFDLGDGNGNGAAPSSRGRPPVPSEEWPRDELLRREKEALGMYVSSHPLAPLRDQLVAQDRHAAPRAPGPARRSGRDGRRDRRLAAPDGDQARRPDGVLRARRHHRLGRDRRLREHLGDVPERPPARRGRPREGPRRPAVRVRGEADRARGGAVRGRR